MATNKTNMNPFDPEKYPNCFRGHQYALDVISKKVVACKYIISACERYLRDLENKEAIFYFDPDAAEKYLRLVQKFEHVKGKWPTKNMVYEPWQCWVFMNIFGFKNKETGFRRFRTAHLEIGRGNGKSPLAGAAVLFCLALDEPNGNMISCVATKTEQAKIVLNEARGMAKKNPSFTNANGVKVLAHTITHDQSNSIARALSSDDKGLDGLNDVLAVIDELHVVSRDIYEVITSGMSKRKDSLLLCITTAGSNTDSVGFYQSDFAKKVATGEFEDEYFFAAVFTVDKEDYWADESVWIKANPNLGVSVDIDSLRTKVQKALVTPSDIPNIKIKHLNMWIAEADAFFDLNAWDKCADPSLKIEDFKGKPVRIGLDMASHLDIATLGYIFEEKKKTGTTDSGESIYEKFYTFFDRSFLPEKTIEEKKNPFYEHCVADGSLKVTKGAAISYDTFKNILKQDSKDFRILETMYDPWNSSQMAQDLSDDIEMVKFQMSTANFSEPLKKMAAMIKSGHFKHNGSKLLKWCAGNVVAKEDHNGNVFPRKSNEKMKIDPVVAGLMALAGWLSSDKEDSVYNERGIRTL